MPFSETFLPSPNFSADRPHEQLGVLFHHSVLGFEEAIARLRDPQSEASYHCLIAADGARCTLVRDDRVAWHAGASEFAGRKRCNDFLLGVAFAGDTYRNPLTESQLTSALEWLEERWVRLRWSLAWITDHRQVSPGRKNDLNPTEWTRLHDAIKRRFAQ